MGLADPVPVTHDTQWPLFSCARLCGKLAHDAALEAWPHVATRPVGHQGLHATQRRRDGGRLVCHERGAKISYIVRYSKVHQGLGDALRRRDGGLVGRERGELGGVPAAEVLAACEARDHVQRVLRLIHGNLYHHTGRSPERGFL